MKILWIVNIVFPYPAQKLGKTANIYGGWLNGLANGLIKNRKIELAIATVYNGKKLLEFNDGEIQYYLVPRNSTLKYNSKTEKFWKEVNQKFKPDLVHIHGTEYPYGLEFMNSCPNVKTVIAIQGLVSEYEKVYYADIEWKDIIKNITFRDIIRHDTIINQKNKFYKRGIYEKQAIKKANAIIGRTTWDYSNCKAINNNIKYYSCNETIRKEFYSVPKWDINNIEKHSIYVSQGQYPIKGLHKLIKAVNLLKLQGYSDIKLYVSGNYIVAYESIKDKLKITGYGNYIRKMIKKFKLENNIIFTGGLDVNKVIDRTLKSNVVVLPSIIENESNSISEASLLGTPVVCSYVGGIVDRIENEINGLTYPFTEENMLAYNIRKIFEDSNLAKTISKNEIEKYSKILDSEKNSENMIEIYKNVLNEGHI